MGCDATSPHNGFILRAGCDATRDVNNWSVTQPTAKDHITQSVYI